MSGQVARGTSNIAGLRPGLVIQVSGHGRDDLERAYLITEVVHRGAAPDIVGELGLGDDVQGGAHYENEFECVPADTAIRPAKLTQRPRVYGPQTAIVTGEAGEEITTDEHGRIKVQFHWEPVRSYDEGASCWVRCSQSWAGLQWGAQFIPRVGMEVVIERGAVGSGHSLRSGGSYAGEDDNGQHDSTDPEDPENLLDALHGRGVSCERCRERYRNPDVDRERSPAGSVAEGRQLGVLALEAVVNDRARNHRGEKGSEDDPGLPVVALRLHRPPS